MTWENRWGPLSDRRRAKAKSPPKRTRPATTDYANISLPNMPQPYAPDAASVHAANLSALASASLVGPLPVPLEPSASVCVVLATYNRLGPLREAVKSVRANAGTECEFVVVDGGSTDGSRRWLVDQSDVTLIGQRGPLTGPVTAFNLGFSFAAERGYRFVLHFNDDAELIAPGSVVDAMDRMQRNDRIGAVAFEMDFRGKWGFEDIHGKVYSNFGLVRREAGIQVARAQGDPTGRLWWNPIYRAYAADSEFGCWLHKLGWEVEQGFGLRVHDLQVQDELRDLNDSENPDRPDSKLFWSRWPNSASMNCEKEPQ